jgi:Flp pilus assembly protein TadG
MTSRRRLDDRGTTSLEFALVVPLMFTFIFTLIEAYFALFNFQQVQAVASDTARCVAIGSNLCTGTNSGQSYAVYLAAPGHGVDALTAAMVSVNASATCGTQSNMVQVVVTYPLARAMPLNFIPAFMSTYNLVGVGCFPNISS